MIVAATSCVACLAAPAAFGAAAAARVAFLPNDGAWNASAAVAAASFALALALAMGATSMMGSCLLMDAPRSRSSPGDRSTSRLSTFRFVLCVPFDYTGSRELCELMHGCMHANRHRSVTQLPRVLQTLRGKGDACLHGSRFSAIGTLSSLRPAVVCCCFGRVVRLPGQTVMFRFALLPVRTTSEILRFPTLCESYAIHCEP